MERGQNGRAGADMVGHRRQVEIDPFAGVALALAVERLVGAVLLEQDHRQQAGADPPARDDVERRRRLGDRLAVPAGELLAHGLLHEPAARDDVEGLGDDLADLGEPAAAAAAAGRRRRHDHPLARQMLRQRPPGGLVPDMRRHDRAGLRLGSLGRRLVLGRGLLELGQLELELVDEPLAPLAGLPELLAPCLGQQQPQALDLEPGAGHQGFGVAGPALGLEPAVALGQDHRVRRGEIGGRDAGSFLTGLMQAHLRQFLKSKDE